MIPQTIGKIVLFLSIMTVVLLCANQQLPTYAESPPNEPSLTPQASFTGIPIFGFETNSGRISNATILNRAKQLGASWVRLNTLSWRDIQPTQETPVDQWTWDNLKTFEQELLSAKDAGLTPLVIADDFPDWAVMPYLDPNTNQEARAPCGPLKEDFFDDYAVFLREVITRYKHPPYHVKYWELGNEVDVDPRLLTSDLQELFGCWGKFEDPYYGGEHYGNMLKVVAPIVRQADPQAKIVIGGLLLDRAETTIPGRGKPEKFLEGILKSGAAESFDVVAFHAYPWYDWEIGRKNDVDMSDHRWAAWGGTTLGKAAYLRSIMSQYQVNKPLFLDESALLFWGGIATEDFYQAQADHLVRVLVRALSADIQQFSWYTLHYSGWNFSGLLKSDQSPLPSFFAYQELIKQVGTSDKPVAVSDYGSNFTTYRFTKGQNLLDVLWTKDGNAYTIDIPKVHLVQATSRDGKVLTLEGTPNRLFASVSGEPLYILRNVVDANTIPQMSTIEPTKGLNDTPKSVMITGKNFTTGMTVWLERASNGHYRNYQADKSVLIDSTHLQAEIPAYLPPDTYDVVVRNAEGQIAVKQQSFTVQALYPHIDSVYPAYGRSDLPNNVHIYGSHFIQDMVIRLGNITLPTTSTMLLHDGHVYVTIPPSFIIPGVYDIAITKPDGTQYTLTKAFRSYSSEQADLYGYANHLWTNPINPHVKQTIQVGQVVQYQNIVPNNANIIVRFAKDTPSNETTFIGEKNIDLPSGSGTARTLAISWTETFTGLHKLCASIDSTNLVDEYREENNTVCRDIQILPPTFDQIPPVIHQMMINGAESATTNNLEVAISVNATDEFTQSLLRTSQENLKILFEEYEYSTGNGYWVPIQSTAWITYTANQPHMWKLTPIPGKKYILAWVADTSGNISQPVSTAITYTTSNEENNFIPPGKPENQTIPPIPLPEFTTEVSKIVYLPFVQRGK